MIGYIAKDDDGSIWLYEEEPTKIGNHYISQNMFQVPDSECFEFENIIKPVKVELNIKILSND